MNLSKSKYCKGVQCPKILWMDEHMPEKCEEILNQAILETGTAVGEAALQYFGEFEKVAFNFEKSKMIEQTSELIKSGANIIAEASFSFNDNFCSVDILQKTSDGYNLIEVKSATDSEKIKDIYLQDVAYQYYVATNAGINIKNAYIMRLNSNYIRQGDLDIKQLFVLTDCTSEILTLQDEVESNIIRIKLAAESKTEPAEGIGARCKKPYECGYRNYCFRNLPENNVYDIGWRMFGTKKDKLYHSGIITFQDVMDNIDNIHLTPNQINQILAVTNPGPPQIQKEQIQEFLDGLIYPLYHLDFETYQQPIPLFDGVYPYQQIPFQYSLHIQEENGNITHKEFLGKEGTDSRRELAENLCKDIGDAGTVLAYNMGFEKGRIDELITLFPDLILKLENINNRMQDLAYPFQAGLYYHRDMAGSWSIKKVLPALCGDDPSLDYHALDLIHNGTEAMEAFANLHEKSPDEIARTRTSLLAYCKLDTLAMIKLLEKMYEAVE
ncbi:DUF2779 domain-containing protein [Treponema sp. R6D11]